MKRIAKKGRESTDNTPVARRHFLSNHLGTPECTRSLFPRLRKESTRGMIREEFIEYSDI
jgi:hypothetical protein